MSNRTFDAPFNSNTLTLTIEDLYPGVNYSFYIFRNVDDASGRIHVGTFNTGNLIIMVSIDSHDNVGYC